MTKKNNNLAAVILAAGKGKRLGVVGQKVVQQVAGKPMIIRLLETVKELSPERIIVVVGHRKEDVFAALRGKDVKFVEQPILLGTGDAVRRTRAFFSGYDGDILVLCGDSPFLTPATLSGLHRAHVGGGNVCTILTAVVENPTGYGRIKKDGDGNVVGIVEEINTSPEEKLIREINSGVYLFRAKSLFPALEHVLPDETKDEYFLTDVIGILAAGGNKIAAYRTASPEETLGINTLAELKQAHGHLK